MDQGAVQLRASEPLFAEASSVQPTGMRQWQAAVYLLTGCRPVWRALGEAVVAQRSLAPVSRALARGSPAVREPSAP